MPDTEGETLVALRAIAALAAAARDDEIERGAAIRRSELVLAGVGLSYQQIASLTGRSPEAVRSLLRRTKSDGHA
jgi:DNA-directed RNA polymerase specialized sigma24 family protein